MFEGSASPPDLCR